jgi:hypothetical protein
MADIESRQPSFRLTWSEGNGHTRMGSGGQVELKARSPRGGTNDTDESYAQKCGK